MRCCCCWVASVVSDSLRPHRWQPILGDLETALVLYCCITNYPQNLVDNTIMNIYYPHNTCLLGIQVCLIHAVSAWGVSWGYCHDVNLTCLSPGGPASNMVCSRSKQVDGRVVGGLTFSKHEPVRLLNVLTIRPQPTLRLSIHEREPGERCPFYDSTSELMFYSLNGGSQLRELVPLFFLNWGKVDDNII